MAEHNQYTDELNFTDLNIFGIEKFYYINDIVVSFADINAKIELGLNEIIDGLMKKALHAPLPPIIPENDYYILGGKAINQIIKKEYMQQSFDYDIHTRDEQTRVNLSQCLVDRINTELTHNWNNIHRLNIYNILKNIGLVQDDTEKEYYMNTNNNLFYYGTRHKRNFGITGLFLKLRFTYGILRNNTGDIIPYNNLRGIPGRPDKITIYMPFADIEQDGAIQAVSIYNLDTPQHSINKVFSKFIWNYDENIFNKIYINYADISIILYNLLKCIHESIHKRKNNISKVRNLFNILNMKCEFTKKFTRENLRTSFQHFNALLIGAIENENFFGGFNIHDTEINLHPIESYIRATKIELFSNNNIKHIFHSFFKKYLAYIESVSMNSINCQIAFGENAINENENYYIIRNGVSNEDKLSTFTAMENILFVLDVLNFDILLYTDTLHYSMNTYIKNIMNNIENVITTPYTKNSENIQLILSNGNTLPINLPDINFATNADYEQSILRISNIFEFFHRDLQEDPLYVNLNDEFYVYTMQEIYFLSLTMINLNNLKPGDVFIYPQFLSTTFNNKIDTVNFITNDRVFLKIKIKKNSRDWLFINKYTMYHPEENEILLNKNCVYVVTDISTKNINIHNETISQIFIEVELVCKITSIELFEPQLNDVITSIVPRIEQSPFFSPCFKRAVNHVRPFLSAEYSDVRLYLDTGTICGNVADLLLDENITFNIDSGPIGERTKTIYRYNHNMVHTIRVCYWIYIYALNLIRYNTFPVYIDFLTPKFILAICIGGLFLVSGRDSEQRAGRHDVPNCRNLPEGKTPAYFTSEAHRRYFTKSQRLFNEYSTNCTLLNENRDLRDDIADCILNYYYYHKFYWGDMWQQDSLYPDVRGLAAPTPRKRLISYLFYASHAIDLFRCSTQSAEIVIPINFRDDGMNDDFNRELEIHKYYAIQVLFNTGDRVLSEQGGFYKNQYMGPPWVYDYDIGFYMRDMSNAPAVYEPHVNMTFYRCSTDIGYCINTINDTFKEYINIILNEIKENANTPNPVRNIRFISDLIEVVAAAPAIYPAPASPTLVLPPPELASHTGGGNGDDTEKEKKRIEMEYERELKEEIINKLTTRSINSLFIVPLKFYPTEKQIKNINKLYPIEFVAGILDVGYKINRKDIDPKYKNYSMFDYQSHLFNDIAEHFYEESNKLNNSMKNSIPVKNKLTQIMKQISKMPTFKMPTFKPDFQVPAVPAVPAVAVAAGGNNNLNEYYKQKYLKYKQKYLELKK